MGEVDGGKALVHPLDEWPSGGLRILRIGMLLFVLVLHATYTANLLAVFIKPAFELIGDSLPYQR